MDPDEAREASLRFVTGERAGRLVCHSDDEGSIEEHSFFDSLREPKKEDAWDAETILSTYTTTENHPTTVRMARKPRRGHEPIRIDERTGLPIGIMVPATEERLRREAEVIGGGGPEDDDEDEERFGSYEGHNLGAARPKQEAAEDKKERKAAAKAMKAARRQEKKGTKEAFRAEKNEQLEIRRKTAQLPMQSLSRFQSH